MTEHEPLFASAFLHDIINSINSEVFEEIQNINKNELVSNIESVSAKLYNKFLLKVPKFVGEPKIKLTDNVDVDISHRWDIDTRYDNPTTKGTRYSFIVKFEGDPNLFRISPQSYSLNQPQGEIDEYEKEFRWHFDRTSEPVDEIKRTFEGNFSRVKQILTQLENECKPFNDSLTNLINGKITDRLNKLKIDKDNASSLGYEIIE